MVLFSTAEYLLIRGTGFSVNFAFFVLLFPYGIILFYFYLVVNFFIFYLEFVFN